MPLVESVRKTASSTWWLVSTCGQITTRRALGYQVQLIETAACTLTPTAGRNHDPTNRAGGPVRPFPT